VLSRSLRRIVPLVLVVLLLASCGDSSDESADTTIATTTTQAPTTTTTVAPATTKAPTTTTVIETSDPTGDDTANESDLPPEAAAVVDEYFRAINEQDVEAFAAVINPAVYEYVFSGTSFTAESFATRITEGFALERYEEVAVQLDRTISNTIYVAISAVRPYVEPIPVNGIMVLEVTEFPDRGWLITQDYRFGL
jgi:hypothetical protein